MSWAVNHALLNLSIYVPADNYVYPITLQVLLDQTLPNFILALPYYEVMFKPKLSPACPWGSNL